MSLNKYTKVLAIVLMGFLWLHGDLHGLFSVLSASAQLGGGGVTPVGTETNIADMVSKAITILNVLAWILFSFMSFLLDPTIIFDLNAAGGDGPFMNMLNQVWQLSRDLMNVAFAFVLVGAALYTILKAEKEFLAQYAPKFLMAIILVNFSWFFPRVILDVANVTAAAIYGIPSMLTTTPAPGIPATWQCVVQSTTNTGGCVAAPGGGTGFRCQCKAVVDVEFFVDNARLTTLRGAGFNYQCPLDNLVCYKEDILTPATTAGFSVILNGLVVNHARLGQLARVPEPPAGARIGQMIMFLVREGLILLIHIALVFPLMAMFVAFLIRIPVLWICMAFMPFMFLDMLGGEHITQGYSKKIWETFLKAAFLPALVAVPFTVGYILLNAGNLIDMSTVGVAAMDRIPIRLFDASTSLYQIMWLCMALGVIWVGVFSILKGDDIMSTGAQSIKGYGESLGKLIAKAPLATPIVPMPSGQSMTPLQFMRATHPRSLDAQLSSGRSIQQALADIGRGNGGDRTVALNERARELSQDRNTAQLTQLNDHIRELAALDRNDTAGRDRIARQMEAGPLRGMRLNRDNLHGDLNAVYARMASEHGRATPEAIRTALERIRTNQTPPAAPTPPTP